MKKISREELVDMNITELCARVYKLEQEAEQRASKNDANKEPIDERGVSR